MKAIAAKMGDSSASSDTPKITIKSILNRYRRSLIKVGVFSILTNVLMLVAPIYMLSIYDRVLTSGSRETLIALTVIALFLLAVYGVLDWVRQRIMARIGQAISLDLADDTLEGVFEAKCNNSKAGGGQPVRDLEIVRQFLCGTPIFAFFDAPWVPFFLAIVFLISPILGYFSLAGALILFTMALLTEVRSANQIKKASDESIEAQRFVFSSLNQAEVLDAMGMFNNMRKRWKDRFEGVISWQADAGDKVSTLLASSKTVRQILQVGILGIGAFLVLRQEITPGAMIGASIIMGRSLAPIEMAISAWRGFVMARLSAKRLTELLNDFPVDSSEDISLPIPQGGIEVERIFVMPPGAAKPSLNGVNFALKPGSLTGIIGASGSGKSTLARALVGVWPVASGVIRLDGANISTWPDEMRFNHIGYMPQEVVLFGGTVADNIARMGEVDDEKVIAAAKLAGCHEMIMRFPEHYLTVVHSNGMSLSAGQRQRVALARSLYGDIKYVVFDEPDSNLDTHGNEALKQALLDLKARNVTVVLITHNRMSLQVMDRVLAIRDGVLVAEGPLQQVLSGKGAS